MVEATLGFEALPLRGISRSDLSPTVALQTWNPETPSLTQNRAPPRVVRRLMIPAPVRGPLFRQRWPEDPALPPLDHIL